MEQYIGLFQNEVCSHNKDQGVGLCVALTHKKATPIGTFAGTLLFRFHITRMELQGRVGTRKAQKMF